MNYTGCFTLHRIFNCALLIQRQTTLRSACDHQVLTFCQYTDHVYVRTLHAKLSARDLSSTQLSAHIPLLCQCVLYKALCAADTEVPPWNSGTVNFMVYRIATNLEYAFRYCNIAGVDNFTRITHFTDNLCRAFPCYAWCCGQYEDLWTMWSCCLYVFYEYYYYICSYSLGSIFYQCIYGFIPVWSCNLCIFSVMTINYHFMFMYGYPDWGFSVLFPQL